MKICNNVVRKWHPLELFPIIHLFWQEASLRKVQNNLMRSQLWTFNSQCTDCSALLSIRQYMRGYFLLAQQARHSEAGQQVHLRWCRPNHWQRVRCLWKPSLSCADMEMHCTALSCSFLNWDVGWDEWTSHKVAAANHPYLIKSGLWNSLSSGLYEWVWGMCEMQSNPKRPTEESPSLPPPASCIKPFQGALFLLCQISSGCGEVTTLKGKKNHPVYQER